jgi:uncharacterized membrane-anchored protein
MGGRGIRFHSEREALTLELHDRPFRPMAAPLRISHLAVATGERGGARDHAQFAALCRRAFEGLYKAGAMTINPTVAAAVSMPIVVLGFWVPMRRLTHRVPHDESR